MIDLHIKEKRFGDHIVLKDIHITLAPGERLAILGPSGIGKSTLLRIANGSDPVFSGSVARPPRQAAVLQQPNLLPWRTASDNLAIFCPQLTARAIAEHFEKVGLAGKESHYPGQLSLGQQRRLALLRGFANAPALLTMDEPFTSLDTVLAQEMLELTKSMLGSIRPTLLFVTHAESEARFLTDRLCWLQGQPARLRAFS